jgi:hypothetical protein
LSCLSPITFTVSLELPAFALPFLPTAFSLSKGGEWRPPKRDSLSRLRARQIRWLYFSFFFTCSYGTKVEKIEKNRSFTTTDKGYLGQFGNLKIENQNDSSKGIGILEVGEKPIAAAFLELGIVEQSSHEGNSRSDVHESDLLPEQNGRGSVMLTPLNVLLFFANLMLWLTFYCNIYWQIMYPASVLCFIFSLHVMVSWLFAVFVSVILRFSFCSFCHWMTELFVILSYLYFTWNLQLSQRTISGSLLKYLSKLQVIASTICLEKWSLERVGCKFIV